MGMHSSVRILIIMESGSFSLSAREDGASLAKNGSFKRCHIFAALSGTVLEGNTELLVSDLTGSSLLALGKDKIDVGIGALLVDDLAILGHLCESLSVHFIASRELSKDFLEATGSTTTASASCCSASSTSLLLAFLYTSRFLLFLDKVNTSHSVGDSSNVGVANLNSSNISIRPVKEIGETLVGINGRGATMGVHSGILVSIVMEPDCFGLRSSQDGALRATNFGMNCSDIDLLFLRKESKTGHKLI